MKRLLTSVLVLLGVAPALAQAQAPPPDQFSSIAYARLGAGAAFALRPRGATAIGLGYRGELETFGLDVSFFNYVFETSPPDDPSRALLAGSILKLAAFRYLSPGQAASSYVGGGLSWGVVSVGSGLPSPGDGYRTSWRGDGLQAELIAGYEIGRTSWMRLFVQGDASLPLFRARADTITYERTFGGFRSSTTSASRYVPSAVVSLGIGWQRSG